VRERPAERDPGAAGRVAGDVREDAERGARRAAAEGPRERHGEGDPRDGVRVRPGCTAAQKVEPELARDVVGVEQRARDEGARLGPPLEPQRRRAKREQRRREVRRLVEEGDRGARQPAPGERHVGDRDDCRGRDREPALGAERHGTDASLTAMPTSLVTGGAGFLGSHLCDALLERGHRVICVDNFETGSLNNIEHIRRPEFVLLNVDIIEPYFVDEPVDFVYHLASPASPIDYLRIPLHTLKVGSYGTHHTLGLAKNHRARFLIASTSEVYGDPQVHPQPESYWGNVNPIGPRGVYDEAKRYAEALTMAYHRAQGVDTAIMRIFNTYGPRMRSHDGRAIPTFLRQALTDRPITVFGEGKQTRSFCFVSDLIDGMIRLAESGYHLPVNIGNPDEFTLLELAQTVVEVTGSKSEIVFEALPTDDPQVRQPDISLAKDILGWEPKVKLREGLERTVEQSGLEALVGAA
jgi:dTDP-glucose 4,6-dehydratase